MLILPFFIKSGITVTFNFVILSILAAIFTHRKNRYQLMVILRYIYTEKVG